MTSIDVAQPSIALQSAVKDGGVLFSFGALAEEAIDDRLAVVGIILRLGRPMRDEYAPVYAMDRRQESRQSP